MDVSKQVAYAILKGPDGLKASKQVAYAQLIYPKIDVAKQVDYANLNRASVQVGKQVVYAILKVVPPGVEVALDFTASGSLDLSYTVEPELQVFVAIDFRAEARLSIIYERNPPFDCEVPETTDWSAASPVTTAWACQTQPTTAWACATDAVTASGLGFLLHTDGSYVLKANGSRIKLI